MLLLYIIFVLVKKALNSAQIIANLTQVYIYRSALECVVVVVSPINEVLPLNMPRIKHIVFVDHNI
jgi:hypothetical protein